MLLWVCLLSTLFASWTLEINNYSIFTALNSSIVPIGGIILRFCHFGRSFHFEWGIFAVDVFEHESSQPTFEGVFEMFDKWLSINQCWWLFLGYSLYSCALAQETSSPRTQVRLWGPNRQRPMAVIAGFVYFWWKRYMILVNIWYFGAGCIMNFVVAADTRQNPQERK